MVVDGRVESEVPQALWGCDGRGFVYVDNMEADIHQKQRRVAKPTTSFDSRLEGVDICNPTVETATPHIEVRAASWKVDQKE